MLYVVIFLAIGLFITLLLGTELLRHGNGNPKTGQPGPYSLSKCQLALWLTIIFCGRVYARFTDTTTPPHLPVIMVCFITTSLLVLACNWLLRHQNKTACSISLWADLTKAGHSRQWHRLQYIGSTGLASLIFLRECLLKKDYPELHCWLAVSIQTLSAALFIIFKTLYHE